MAPDGRKGSLRVRLYLRQSLLQGLDIGADLVAHRPVVRERLLLSRRALRQLRRVVERPVFHLRRPWKLWTLLGRVGADRHHPVETDVAKLVDLGRLLSGNIDPASAITLTACGLGPRLSTSGECASNPSALSTRAKPSAIWLRQELPVQRESNFSMEL